MRGTILNALRVALRIISGKIILYFGTPERLRTLRCSIFTGGVVTENGSCSAAFCESAALRGYPLRLTTFARFPLLSPTVTSSTGAGEVFPQRESQAVKFSTKVLGIMRKFPAVLLALPLGELAPQVTERAHTVALSAKVSSAIRSFPATQKAPPFGGAGIAQR